MANRMYLELAKQACQSEREYEWGWRASFGRKLLQKHLRAARISIGHYFGLIFADVVVESMACVF
ncbi:hypothetical protein [Vibrio jasicida]|uniref:hypothetical protein n=1 Tax=Vibrio jasicida TaxID=766224 RepID=UPI0013151462|nr:hypothetical protein [Vibrio jasicida]